MKSFFKKYPRLIFYMGLMILMIASYIGYTMWYNSKNEKAQKVYDSLNENAWTDVSGETVSTSVETANNSEDLTTDEDVTPVEVKEFLEMCGNRRLYAPCFKRIPDFGEYRNTNKDVVGYLLIPDTKISYPILQSKTDNEYYLKHNIDGSSGYPGCIYIENYNNDDFEDPITILYGHNMKNNTMFGQLDEYRDASYRKKHQFIFIYEEGEINIYKVIVCSVYDEEHLLAHDFVRTEGSKDYTFSSLKEGDQVTVFNKLKAFGAYNSYFDEEGVTDKDKCIALATCSGDTKRYIVVAKRINYIDSL